MTFQEMSSNWDPDIVWPLFSQLVKNENPRSVFDNSWRQYFLSLGHLKRYEPAICEDGVLLYWPWVKLGWDVMYKCMFNSSFENRRVMFMIDIIKNDSKWEIQRLDWTVIEDQQVMTNKQIMLFVVARSDVEKPHRML